jgi:hypothetical protein
MSNRTDNLKAFFEKIKSMTFWTRLFSWKPVKTLSYEAYEEFRKLSDNVDDLERLINEKDILVSDLGNQIKILNSKADGYNKDMLKFEARISGLEKENERINGERNILAKTVAKYEQSENTRLDEYQKNISNINAIREGLENERKKLNDDRVREKELSFEQMKQKWHDHEEAVKKAIRTICVANGIEYLKDVPFRGKPDNTINIAGEYVIFDAKSPAGDDLENFPRYLKLQTESVSKYIKQENVKSEIFLVVPSSTVDVIGQFSYRMGDYNVYVVTIDALEPIILALRKIEDYEFTEQLTPEERENICRIIGKFAHTAKRKIMIDYFFSFQFLDIISKANLSLPEDIKRSVIDFEKSEKLNPPQEKRTKLIPLEELLAESERLATEAKARIEMKKDDPE